MLIGAVLCALLFGSVALQLAHFSLSRIRFAERMRVVNESMHFYRLPRALQEKTRTRYEYAWKQYRDLQSDELLYSLSPTLKRDICMHLYADMLRRVALFAECTSDVMAALCEALKPQFYLEGDTLCREGEAGKEMFFLKCGVVTISQRVRGVLGHLDAGEYFGEMCASRRPSQRPRCRREAPLTRFESPRSLSLSLSPLSLSLSLPHTHTHMHIWGLLRVAGASSPRRRLACARSRWTGARAR